MKKNFVPYIILTILFVLFHIFAFAIPSNRTATFWIAYGFTITMFSVEIVVLFMAFTKNKTPEKQFLSWPLISIGAIYFVVQIILFFPFKLFPSIQSWIAVITFSLVFAIALICIIATKASIKQISSFDETHKR